MFECAETNLCQVKSTSHNFTIGIKMYYSIVDENQYESMELFSFLLNILKMKYEHRDF